MIDKNDDIVVLQLKDVIDFSSSQLGYYILSETYQ